MFNILNTYYTKFCTISRSLCKCKQICDPDHVNTDGYDPIRSYDFAQTYGVHVHTLVQAKKGTSK